MDRLRIDLCELLTNSVLEILKKSNYMTVADVVLTPPEEIAEICSLPLKVFLKFDNRLSYRQLHFKLYFL